MTTVPKNAKQPSDRKKKTEKFDPDQPFTFDHKGETYEIDGVLDVVDGGFMRRSRHMDALDITMTILEECAEPDVLEVVDGMDLKSNLKFLERFDGYVESVTGAALGES